MWWFPADPDPDRVQGGAGVIVDEAGSVIVDAGHSPALALQIQARMVAKGLPPARWLVYTHHHWDHVWGACAWPDVEIVGHEIGRDLLVREAARPWSDAYLADEIAANPRLGPSFRARAMAVDAWEGFVVLPPTRTFTDEFLLPTGVHLRHVGGNHAPDSIVVTVPGSSVMLLGDCIYPPPAHLREPDDGLDLELARSLLDEGSEWYIAAHAEPFHGSDQPPWL